jgi:dihydroorotase
VLSDVFRAMQDVGMILQLHAETSDPEDLVLVAEERFIPAFRKLVQQFPRLKISVEHVTSRVMVQTVMEMPEHVVMSITLHHLFLTFQRVMGSHIFPHNFCKPVAKNWQDRSALIQHAISQDAKIRAKCFFGSDSAPHEEATAKHCDKCCAGVFSAPVIPELLVELFEKLGALDVLPEFAVHAACRYYGHTHSGRTMRFVRTPQTVPMLHGPYRSFWAGQTLAWSRVP